MVAQENVITKRLGDFGFRDCSFIKLDVEGHEEAVLDGAMHLIENQRRLSHSANPRSFRFHVNYQKSAL